MNLNPSPYGELSVEEKRVIENRGTEFPFTGKYTDEFQCGLYACRKCGAPLYRSDDKFQSSCGWPAFDDEIPGAVKRMPDSDGVRTEISCSCCGGHLGHVFFGEHLTGKNTRHCVNSVSMVFEPQETGRLQRAVFAGGCFWGVEEFMRRQSGVLKVTNGFSGGELENPTYHDVCSGRTGHAESVEIIFESGKTDFETICRYFLEIHDPTQLYRQGPDIGSQYRSVIFYFDEKQKKIAEKLLSILREKGYSVVTELVRFYRFWNAEEYHQDYYQRKGDRPYCHRFEKRF